MTETDATPKHDQARANDTQRRQSPGSNPFRLELASRRVVRHVAQQRELVVQIPALADVAGWYRGLEGEVVLAVGKQSAYARTMAQGTRAHLGSRHLYQTAPHMLALSVVQRARACDAAR